MPSRSPTLQGKSMKMKVIVGIPLVVFCLFIPLSGNIGEEPIEIDMQKECFIPTHPSDLLNQVEEHFGNPTRVVLEKIMKRGAFDSVRLSYFGRFHVNPKRLIKLNDAAFQRRQFSSSNKSGS